MWRFQAAVRCWRPDFEVPRYLYVRLSGLRYDRLDGTFPYAPGPPQMITQMITECLPAEWAVEQGGTAWGPLHRPCRGRRRDRRHSP